MKSYSTNNHIDLSDEDLLALRVSVNGSDHEMKLKLQEIANAGIESFDELIDHKKQLLERAKATLALLEANFAYERAFVDEGNTNEETTTENDQVPETRSEELAHD